MSPGAIDYMRIEGDMPEIYDYTTVTTTSGTGEWVYYCLADGCTVMWAKSKDKIKEAMRGYTAKKGRLYRRIYE